jgi:2-polyprenyl-3-methyl-5-hydroxy-6-metoxy-1,4-benzoquinol methylase
MYTYSNCLVCGNQHFSNVFTAIDYTVSKEEFQIVACNSCGFTFTNPRPENDKLGPYYHSDAYISHSDTSKGLINKLYKAVRKITLRSKFRLIKKYISNGVMLDIGAGTGAFLSYCTEKGIKSIGVEPDSDARTQAKKLYNLGLKPESILSELANSSCDVITMWHVMEHVPLLHERVAELARLLSDEGIIAIAVPNHKSYDAQYYKQYWGAYDVPRHLYHFDKQSITSVFDKHNLQLVDIQGMPFDSFYVSLLSEKYMTGKTNWIRAFRTGLLSYFKSGRDNWSSQIYLFAHKAR